MGVKYSIFILFTAFMCCSLGYGLAQTGGPQKLLPSSAVSPERGSPSDWITQEQIQLYDDRVVIMLDDPQWAIFTDTNSMDPLLDEGAHGIQMVPQSPAQLEVGDIISFTTPYADGIIVHRIIELGEDEKGWYALTKGDNSPLIDPGKVRFSQVHRVLVGVLY